MKYPLTKKQKKYFEFIKKYIQENEMSPSYEEIQKGMKVAGKGVVFTTLYNLEKRGWIKKLPATARSIVLIDD